MSTHTPPSKKTSVICYVAGASGGHIIPCLTMARENQKKHPETKALFFSTEQALDIELISAAPCVDLHVTLALKKASACNAKEYVSLIWRSVASFFKAGYYLLKYQPEKIICTGGFIALPVALWGRMLAIPIEWYELNAEPGKATKWVAQWHITICTTFEQTQHHLPQSTCVKKSYPIRFFNTAQLNKQEARLRLKLDPSRKTICVLGGSQGSITLNQHIKQWLDTYPWVHAHTQIIHQTGRNDATNWHAFYAQLGIPAVVCSFSHELELFYAASDMIISRAGAGSLFETLFFSIPAIIIPLETTDNQHQVANARAMQQSYDEMFTILLQKELLKHPEKLHQVIIERLALQAPIGNTTTMQQSASN